MIPSGGVGLIQVIVVGCLILMVTWAWFRRTH